MDRKADDRGRISLPPSDYAGEDVKVVLCGEVVLVIDSNDPVE